MQSLM